MKVLSIEKFYFLSGGAARVFFETNKLLTNNGHKVIPFACKHSQNEYTPYEKYFPSRISMFTGHETSKPSIYKLLVNAVNAHFSFDANKLLDELLNYTKPDIVHIHNLFYQLSPSIIKVIKKYNIPVIQTIHTNNFCPNGYMYSKGEICERCKNGAYYNTLLRKCWRGRISSNLLAMSTHYFYDLFKLYPGGIDHFISPSKFFLKKSIEWGINENQITYIPNFIVRGDFKNIKNIKEEYFCYVGNFIHQKGIFTLLRSMLILNKNIKLLLCGGGELEGEIKKYIQKYKLENIILTGFLGKSELYDKISKARFIVLPSLWWENNPMSILEANALGTPVIGSYHGGISELIKDMETGILFKPGDSNDLASKIEFAFQNTIILEEMGKKAKNFIFSNFNEELYYNRLLNLYNSLIYKRI